MEFKFDTRGGQTVFDLGDTKRLFQILERELKNTGYKSALEHERDTIVENEEDNAMLSLTLGGFERHFEAQEQSLRATEIIRLFVILEGHLKTFCKSIKADKKLSLGIADFRGGLIEQSKRFLCDYAGIIEENHPAWGTIHKLQKMRNHLVHSAVKETSAENRETLSKLGKNFQKFPDLVTDGELILTRELCDYLHDSVTLLFKVLFKTQGWESFEN